MRSNFSNVLGILFFSISYLLSLNLICESLEMTNDFKGSILNLRYKPMGININTKTLKKVFTTTPLTLTNSMQTYTYLVNTGSSVQTTNLIHDYSNATGGMLKSDFIFETFAYYWAGKDTKGIVGTTIDGKGFPYEVRILWRNIKYNTLSQAVQHWDGLAELVLLYDICSTPNVQFKKFGDTIKKIQKAGSSAMVTLSLLVNAADFIPVNSTYYSYLGSFLDTWTWWPYKCTTVILIKPNAMYCITPAQFQETFCSLRDFCDKPYSNTLPRDFSYTPISSVQGGIAQNLHECNN